MARLYDTAAEADALSSALAALNPMSGFLRKHKGGSKKGRYLEDVRDKLRSAIASLDSEPPPLAGG